MACRISELVIDAADPGRLAAFWSQVLGYVELGREDDGSIEIGPPDAGFGGLQPTLVLSPSTRPAGREAPATHRRQRHRPRPGRRAGAAARSRRQTRRRRPERHRELARSSRPRRQRILPPAHPAPAPLTTSIPGAVRAVLTTASGEYSSSRRQVRPGPAKLRGSGPDRDFRAWLARTGPAPPGYACSGRRLLSAAADGCPHLRTGSSSAARRKRLCHAMRRQEASELCPAEDKLTGKPVTESNLTLVRPRTSPPN